MHNAAPRNVACDVLENSTPWPTEALVQRRRNFALPGYATLADVGFDGPWVSPYQISSRSRTGPVILAYNWLDVGSVDKHRAELKDGYLPGMLFNRVLEKALEMRGLTRSDIYVTQSFHLLPNSRSAAIPTHDLIASFEAVTQHELKGRAVVALGQAQELMCHRFEILAQAAPHPSARGLSIEQKASEIADALAKAGF